MYQIHRALFYECLPKKLLHKTSLIRAPGVKISLVIFNHFWSGNSRDHYPYCLYSYFSCLPGFIAVYFSVDNSMNTGVSFWSKIVNSSVFAHLRKTMYVISSKGKGLFDCVYFLRQISLCYVTETASLCRGRMQLRAMGT